MASIPRMALVDPRAVEIIAALQERARVRLALGEAIAAMEDHLARPEPVPPALFEEFERLTLRLGAAEARLQGLVKAHTPDG